MRILGLPGRRPATFQPLADLLARVAGPADRVEVRRYEFWRGDFTNPDIEPEAVRVAGLRADLVVGWSIGVLVAMAARERHGLAASAWVFLGAPVNRLTAEGRLELLAGQARAAPTLFIQQTADPTGSFAELAAALPETAELREVPGNDHGYGQTAELAATIAAWPPLAALR